MNIIKDEMPAFSEEDHNKSDVVMWFLLGLTVGLVIGALFAISL